MLEKIKINKNTTCLSGQYPMCQANYNFPTRKELEPIQGNDGVLHSFSMACLNGHERRFASGESTQPLQRYYVIEKIKI